MIQDYRDRNKKAFDTLQTVRHFVMGIMFGIMGVLLFVADKYKIAQLQEFDKTFRYLFGAICLLYATFRIYRGIKKNY